MPRFEYDPDLDDNAEHETFQKVTKNHPRIKVDSLPAPKRVTIYGAKRPLARHDSIPIVSDIRKTLDALEKKEQGIRARNFFIPKLMGVSFAARDETSRAYFNYWFNGNHRASSRRFNKAIVEMTDERSKQSPIVIAQLGGLTVHKTALKEVSFVFATFMPSDPDEFADDRSAYCDAVSIRKRKVTEGRQRRTFDDSNVPHLSFVKTFDHEGAECLVEKLTPLMQGRWVTLTEPLVSKLNIPGSAKTHADTATRVGE